MAKTPSKFVCNNCGYESIKWLGKCPSCSKWNTLVEEAVEPKTTHHKIIRTEAVALNRISNTEASRFSTGMVELDRVLGGGMVAGSLILVGGPPGIGKSTLLLQLAGFVAASGKRVLYLSGEESLNQIRLRSRRLHINSDNIFLLNEQNIDILEIYIKEIDPQIIIIDSIQTVYSENITSIPGSVSQLRECTARIMEQAKKSERVFFIAGHVTKDGAIAGPRLLEHMVDVVIYFEGEKNFSYRILRGVKNRFGSTDEIGLLEMTAGGLLEVLDPSSIFLSNRDPSVCGSAVVASFEGSRPLLIEIQALVSSSVPAYARRMASGVDQNRLSLIIAVLEKRRNFKFSNYDVFLKITGGLFLKDPSVDLGIAAAILSSYQEKPLPPDTVFSGELALSGEIRAVPFVDARLNEAWKMGYKRIILPVSKGKRENYSVPLDIIEVKNLDELIDIIMEG